MPEESFGAALQYFTGSKEHNVALRSLAQRRGLTINEYGVFRVGEDGKVGERVAGATEEDVYAAVGLACVPPELRENHGELEAAARGALPTLIETRDLRGDVHMHTVETDGSATIEEMAEAALARGHGYIAVTDHTKALAMVRGLDDEHVRAHAARIREVDRELRGSIRVLAGIEVDILQDGGLDLDAETLSRLDVVIGSVHSRFGLGREEMTDRIVRAIESGAIDVVGHPTGRLILKRDPYDIDMERIMRAAKEHGVAMELNGSPYRLDLCDAHCRMAKELGVKVVLDSDAHSTGELASQEHGIEVARRAGFEKADVLNTRPCDDFLAALHEGHR